MRIENNKEESRKALDMEVESRLRQARMNDPNKGTGVPVAGDGKKSRSRLKRGAGKI